VIRGRETGPAIAGLGEQPRGAYRPGARKRGEDVRVGVGGQLGGDLGLQGLDLGGQGGQRGHQGAGDSRPGSPVSSGRPARGGLQPGVQLTGVMLAASSRWLSKGIGERFGSCPSAHSAGSRTTNSSSPCLTFTAHAQQQFTDHVKSRSS
jgi:hypothetical protein